MHSVWIMLDDKQASWLTLADMHTVWILVDDMHSVQMMVDGFASSTDDARWFAELQAVVMIGYAT